MTDDSKFRVDLSTDPATFPTVTVTGKDHWRPTLDLAKIKSEAQDELAMGAPEDAWPSTALSLVAEVERLTAGADPTPVPEMCRPTPAQVIHMWNIASAERRQQMAEKWLDDARRAFDCLVMAHDSALHQWQIHDCKITRDWCEREDYRAQEERIADLESLNISLIERADAATALAQRQHDMIMSARSDVLDELQRAFRESDAAFDAARADQP